MAASSLIQAIPLEASDPGAAPQPPVDLQRSTASSLLVCVYRGGYRLGSHRIMQSVLRMALKLEGGEFFSHTARRLMREWHNLDIGAYSYGCFDDNRFAGGARIGRYVSIARSVRSYRRNHPSMSLSMHPFFYSEHFGASRSDQSPPSTLVIEHDAWIGAHALILPGCRRIGIGAVVGAGAVVTRDVDPFTVVAGNPAREIRKRFPPETMARILHSRWWARSYSDLQRTIEQQERNILSNTGTEQTKTGTEQT